MVKALQSLGDRLVGRFVPEVVAEAGVQDYQTRCRCVWDSPTFIEWVKNCDRGVCGPCYIKGGCKP
jgi:hypothetical protein